MRLERRTPETIETETPADAPREETRSRRRHPSSEALIMPDGEARARIEAGEKAISSHAISSAFRDGDPAGAWAAAHRSVDASNKRAEDHHYDQFIK